MVVAHTWGDACIHTYTHAHAEADLVHGPERVEEGGDHLVCACDVYYVCMMVRHTLFG